MCVSEDFCHEYICQSYAIRLKALQSLLARIYALKIWLAS